MRRRLRRRAGLQTGNSSSAHRFETVGVNFDPSHLLWMGADPLAAIASLGSAIYHVHAKDTRLEPQALARDGRIEIRPAEDVAHRAWNYVTLGRGHDEPWWRRFCQALAVIGYDDVLSIEHEDPFVAPEIGIREAAQLLSAALKEPRAAKALA